MEELDIKGQLLDSVAMLSEKVSQINDPPNRVIMGNEELANFLNISTRTLQDWRDKGIIGFSKIGKSIFYKLSDVLDMLESNYHKPFA